MHNTTNNLCAGSKARTRFIYLCLKSGVTPLSEQCYMCLEKKGILTKSKTKRAGEMGVRPGFEPEMEPKGFVR